MQARDIYSNWLTELKEDVAEFGIWQAEAIENTSDLDFHYNQFLTELATQLEENGVTKPFVWLAKAEKQIARAKDKLTSKFDIPYDDDHRSGIANSETLFGFNQIDPNNTQAIKRKRLWVSLPELIDYMLEVPYPAGIETVYNSDGSVRGYYLWVEK